MAFSLDLVEHAWFMVAWVAVLENHQWSSRAVVAVLLGVVNWPLFGSKFEDNASFSGLLGIGGKKSISSGTFHSSEYLTCSDWVS